MNGKSVKALYGVTYLYAATGLFKAVVAPTVIRYAACGTYLRTSASTSAVKKTLLKTDTKVTVSATVGGSGWKTTCAGNAVAGPYVVPDHQHQRPERQGAVRRALPLWGVGPVQGRRDDIVRPEADAQADAEADTHSDARRDAEADARRRRHRA